MIWKVVAPTDGNDIGDFSVFDDRFLVAHVWGRDRDIADLISAAPDMLAALEAVWRVAKDADLPGPTFLSIEERNLIRAAIAKAKGGQS